MKYQTSIFLGALLIVLSVHASVREDFDFGWRFHLGDVPRAEQSDFDDGGWQSVELPHDYSIEQDFSQTNASCTAFLPGGIGWYRKTFVSHGGKLDRVGIEFDGVSRSSQVWINGHLLGGHPYAYTPFYFDLTPWVRARGGTNTIAIRVNRERIDDSRWYPGSGIIRRVWLVKNGDLHFQRHGLFVSTPNVTTAKADVVVQIALTNELETPSAARVFYQILSPSGAVVWNQETQPLTRGGMTFRSTAEIFKPEPWSPEDPKLYRLTARISRGDETVDEEAISFGARSIRYDAQNGFFLNGRPVKLHGVCLHQDAGGLGGGAVLAPVWERRLKILKGMGVNAVRCAHNPAPAFFYDLCDRLGMMVMDEAFDEWNGAKRKWIEGWNVGQPSHGAGYSEFFDQWSAADAREMVLRSRNHPSIIMWSIGNEIDYPGDPFSYPTDEHYNPDAPSAEILAVSGKRLAAEVRQLDPTRPVVAALANLKTSNATGLADLLDVVGYNYQFDQYAPDMEKYPKRKLFGSENGYGPNYFDLTQQNSRVFGQFLWVGIDYLGESKHWPLRGWDDGLLDTCGFFKPRAAARAALWAEQPMVYLCVGVSNAAAGAHSWQGDFGWRPLEAHWNWVNDSRKELPVLAYSNCKEVDLFLNGRALGSGTRRNDEGAFHWRVPFEAGELKAVGRTSDGRTVETKLVTAGDPSTIRLTPDRTALKSGGEDAVHIVIDALDAKGNPVLTAALPIQVSVAGAGTLAGLDNGDQSDTTRLTDSHRNLHRGHALALVRSDVNPGFITVTVTSPNLPSASLELRNE